MSITFRPFAAVLLALPLCGNHVLAQDARPTDGPTFDVEAAAPMNSLPGRWPADVVPEEEKGLSPGVITQSVPATVRLPKATYIESANAGKNGYVRGEIPVPSITRHPASGRYLKYDRESGAWVPKAVPALLNDFDSIDFNDDGANTGFLHIPADPHGAAGPNHVVNVVNTSLAFHQKNGTEDFQDALEDFFSGETPNRVFDPKVLFDQFEGRYLIVVLDQTDEADGGGATNTSFILLAVSDDADPNGIWFTTKIDSLVDIGGTDHWADYPGFAVDEEAVYITNNMFEFEADGGAFGGALLWVVDKSGFYSGGPSVVSQLNPYDCGLCIATTTQPAHLYGPAIGGVGTFLVSFNGIHSLATGVDAVQVVRIDDPLGSPTFDQDFVDFGNVDDSDTPMPLAPQSGIGDLLETNDKRALDAVWYENSVWMSTTIVPNTGDPDAGEATAYWLEIDVTDVSPSNMTIADQGAIGGETVATGTYTSFPSIAVNGSGHTAIGFSGSAPSIFPGAFYTTRSATDSAGFTEPPGTLRSGVDYYVRRFCGSRNRWGDYSGMSVDPETGCFWAYNKYAKSRGNAITDCDGNPDVDEDGRWATAYGRFCPSGACPVDMVLANTTLAASENRKAAWSISTYDNVNVGSVADIVFTTRDHVSIGPGFNVDSGGTFKVTLSMTPCS